MIFFPCVRNTHTKHRKLENEEKKIYRMGYWIAKCNKKIITELHAPSCVKKCQLTPCHCIVIIHSKFILEQINLWFNWKKYIFYWDNLTWKICKLFGIKNVFYSKKLLEFIFWYTGRNFFTEKFIHSPCKTLMKSTPGVNFINILRTAFTLADPKSRKKYS